MYRLHVHPIRTLCCSLALLTLAPSVTSAQDAAPTEAQLSEARSRFEQGVALAQANNCSGALSEFAASMAIIERPSTRFNMAQCEEELHHYDLAIGHYERYLEIAPPRDPNRPAAEATMRALRNLLGTLRVRSNVAAEIWLDDRIIGQTPGGDTFGEILLPGGHHAIELRASAHLPARREVDVTARSTTEVDVVLEEAEQTTQVEQRIEQRIEHHVTVSRQPLPQPVFFTALGLTLASAAAGATLGTYANVRHSEIAGLDPYAPRQTGDIRDTAIAADIAFGAAGVFLVGSVVVAFLTDWGGPATTETTETTLTPTAMVIPTPQGLSGAVGLQGAF